MERQTIDQMIGEYGFRLAELENLFYVQNGFSPSYDCYSFWEDPIVSKVQTMIDLLWDLKRKSEGNYAS